MAFMSKACGVCQGENAIQHSDSLDDSNVSIEVHGPARYIGYESMNNKDKALLNSVDRPSRSRCPRTMSTQPEPARKPSRTEITNEGDGLSKGHIRVTIREDGSASRLAESAVCAWGGWNDTLLGSRATTVWR